VSETWPPKEKINLSRISRIGISRIRDADVSNGEGSKFLDDGVRLPFNDINTDVGVQQDLHEKG
jgi:hypothetical protein